MFVSLIITSFNDFARVRLVLFLGRISKETHIVVYVKVEQRARLSARLVDNKVVESMVLYRKSAPDNE
jgi:hypothetical protein